MHKAQIANLICSSPIRNHDYDFARIALGQALYDAYDILTDCYQDYENTEAILAGDLLVTYTSQVPVSDKACEALQTYLENGGRWFALHATNSVRDNKRLPGILGTKFITHPPYMRFQVELTAPEDPLIAGIGPFEVDDELYLLEQHQDDIEVLLHTRWGGTAPRSDKVWEEADQPLMYRRRVGKGGVLYLALGHANRPFCKPTPEWPMRPDQRGPWENPMFKELIRRGVEWAAGRRPL